MRTRTFLLLVLLFVSTVQAAAAQPDRVTRDYPGVTFTLQGLLAPRAPGELSLPLPLLQRIAREGPLVSLETHPGAQGRPRFQARFVFADMEAFTEWYGRADTRSLISDVRAATTSDSLELLVSVRRDRAER
ncbi:MAG TPA: hypothetical protein VF006_11480 [Longimicrobium sp.]